jgi:hypothetical protein
MSIRRVTVPGRFGAEITARLLPAGAFAIKEGTDAVRARYNDWPIIVVSEVEEPGLLADDDCVINPPRPDELSKAFGLPTSDVLTLVCCTDEDHVYAYCFGPEQPKEYAILWDYTDNRVEFLGAFTIAEVEAVLGEPLFAPVTVGTPELN